MSVVKFNIDLIKSVSHIIEKVLKGLTDYKRKRTQKKEEQTKEWTNKLLELNNRLHGISPLKIPFETAVAHVVISQYESLQLVVNEYIALSQGSFSGIKSASECHNWFRDAFQYLNQIYKGNIAYNSTEFEGFYKDIFGDIYYVINYEIYHLGGEKLQSDSGSDCNLDQLEKYTFGDHSQSAWFITLHKLAGSTA